MKYLKLYEAFKSKGISNTLKFLKNKVGKSSSEEFKHTLLNFMESVDYPIDQLSDDNIKYLSAKKAIQLKSEKEVTNSKGIWVLKFWFSIEKGYLGYSATGNEVKEEEEYSGGRKYRDQQQFTETDLEYIKQNITRTGEIWPVYDYSKLKTGDNVIGLFDGYSDRHRIGMAKIYVDESDDNRTYAIQSVASGSFPESRNWRDYTEYGSQSWWLYSNEELGGDHNKLYYWKQSEDELHYIEPPKEDNVEEEKEENPLTWNLPLSNRFSFSRWGRGSSISKDGIKNADFALVLYYDDLINPEKDAEVYEKPSETRKQRSEEKEGATKLMTDDKIKKMNIERYVQKLVVSLEITETDFFNLEKIVSKHLSREFSYISIYNQKPDWTDLSSFTDYLYQVVDTDDKMYYINKVKDMYKRQTEIYYNQLLRYQTNKEPIKGNSQLKKIFDEIFKLGNEISTSFAKKELNTIDDLWLTNKKIRSLYDWIKMSRNQFNYQVREVISGFRYSDETNYYFSQYENQYSEENYKQDLEKINRIRSFIKNL